MTIDDESSIYVGGLPYDSTKDTVLRVFEFYGAVLDVKIINDHTTRGKCYGFVTFVNPRAANDAINDMNGRTIEGRVVRVNGVKTRGGRSNFGRESFRRNVERGTDWDRGRDRERDHDHDHDRDRLRDRNSDWSRERDRSRDHEQERERGYDHSRGHDRARDLLLTRDRDQVRDMVDNEHSRNHELEWERDHDLDLEQGREWDRTNGHDKNVDSDRDQQSKRQNGFGSNDGHGSIGRELSSEASDDYNDQLKEELEISTQRLDELRKEIPQIEERLEEKQKLVLDLQKQSKKLEDALIASKKHTSYRQVQLTKLYKCFMQVKDYSERLKSCEEELQTLVDTAMLETDVGDDVG